MADDADSGDRTADRLAVVVFGRAVEEAVGPYPPGVQGHRPGGPGGLRAGPADPVRPVVPTTADPSRSRAAASVAGAGDDVGVFPVHDRDDDPVAAGRRHPVRDVGADPPDRPGDQDAAVGPRVRDRRYGAGQRAGGGVRRDVGHADPAGSAPGSRVQGDGRTQQRVPGDLVPARPALHLAGRLQHATGRVVDAGQHPHRAVDPGPAGGPAGGRLRLDADVAAAGPADRADPAGAAGPRLLRAGGHSGLLGRPPVHRPLRRRHRLPERGERGLRRATRRTPRPLVGQAGRGYRPGPPRHRGEDAPGPGHGTPKPSGSHPPARRRPRRHAAGAAGLRRPVRRRLHQPHHGSEERVSTATKPKPQPAAAKDGMPSMIAYLTRALKTPTIGAFWEELAAQARDENWSHEEYLAALLQRQVADRESKGTVMRIRTAHFPAVKTLEDFNLDHLPSLRRDLLAHLATGTFVAKAENVILLGPPGLGKTHLAIGLGVKAAHAGYSVLFDTASNWITRLADAHHAGRLEAELKKIRRYKLIIIDEVGYIPFDRDAANLFFQLIASRYEQGSVMVTSNLPFGRWGETFSDDVVAAAMIDRLVHHAEVLTLTGDSYRTRQRRELLAKENRASRD